MSINVTPIPRLIDLAVPAFTFGETNTAGTAGTAVSSNSAIAIIATQAELESASSNALAISPGRAQFHPSASKAWAKVEANGGSGYLQYNVSGLAKNATGDYTVTFDDDMADNGYAVVLSCSNTATAYFTSTYSAATGSCRVEIQDSSGTNTDQQFGLIVMGDL